MGSNGRVCPRSSIKRDECLGRVVVFVRGGCRPRQVREQTGGDHGGRRKWSRNDTETASNFKELHIIIRMKHRIWHQVGQRCSAVEIGAVLGGKSDMTRSGFPQHLPKLVSLGIPHLQPPRCLHRLREVLCIFYGLCRCDVQAGSGLLADSRSWQQVQHTGGPCSIPRHELEEVGELEK